MTSQALAMKSMLVGAIMILFCSHSLEAGERYLLRKTGRWDDSLSTFSFDSVNMQPLFEKARERYPSITEDELAPRVKMNINYIFHNRLNRARFLVAPSPQSIIEQIGTIFGLSEELSRLMGNGRELLMREQAGQYAELVKKVGKTAGELKSSFEGFFVDMGSSHCVIEYPRTEPISAQFVHFILQSEKINRDLAERLNEFFFGASPGAIALTDYKMSSIHVLSESLCRLSRLAEKELGHSGQLR